MKKFKAKFSRGRPDSTLDHGKTAGRVQVSRMGTTSHPQDMAKQLPSFKYDVAIRKLSIRLLKVLPKSSAEKQGGHLEFRLKEYAFGDELSSLDFWTLSYTWGPPDGDSKPYKDEDRIPIIIDNQIFLVFPTLYDFLFQLKNTPDATNKLIWIDAICINQGDITEREKQVEIMDQIYVKASVTLLWLGKSVREQQKVIDLISPFDKIALEDLISLAGANQLTRLSLDTFSRYNLPTKTEDWLPLYRFFQRQWFTRMWIIQEVALSKNPIIMWGDMLLSWLCITKAALFISRCTMIETSLIASQISPDVRTLELTYDPSTKSPASRAFLIAQTGAVCQSSLNVLKNGDSGLLEQAARLCGSSEITANSILLVLALMFPDSHVTDSRDRIFSLLGLAHHIAGIAKIRKETIPVIYNASHTENDVYFDLMVALLEETKSLAAIACLNNLSNDSTRPSWIPNSTMRDQLWNKRRMDVCGRFNLSTSNTTFRIEGRKLFVQAHKLCKISTLACSAMDIAKFDFKWVAAVAALGPKYRYPTYNDEDSSTMLHLWRTLLCDADGFNSPSGRVENSYSSVIRWVFALLCSAALLYHSSQPDILRQSLKGALALASTIDCKDEEDNFRGSLERFIEFDICDRDMRPLPNASLLEIAAYMADPQTREFFTHAQMNIDRSMFRRRLLISDQEHLIMGPESARPNDVVAVIHGCPTPMVLRPRLGKRERDSEYVVVGSAYVCGVMEQDHFGKKHSYTASLKGICLT